MIKDRIISFFIKRHLLSNLIFAGIFIAGIIAWHEMPREELPDVTFDIVRVSANYPGAAADEVEYFVTRPIEEAIRALDGIYSITSSTSIGTSSVTVEIDRHYPDKDELITEIRNVVLDVDLPADVIDDPNVRVFKTSRKAIIDIALISKGQAILDVAERKKLHSYALVLENKLQSLSEVSFIQRSGDRDQEIIVKVDPNSLYQYEIPFNKVMREISDNNVRQPAGNIEDAQEAKVSLSAELRTVDELKNLAIQGGFEGQVIRLSQIADVEEGFKKSSTILKINGHEGIILNVTKSSQAGIVEATDAVRRVVNDFSKNNLKGTSVEVVLLDDESVDVRNRLSIITFNGGIGFILIFIILFIFLDVRSGVWAAMGIPFTFCFTLFGALMLGYTINNITLAAVIIVMGMVVDDAIVVSENITRLRFSGLPAVQAGVKGTSQVFLPIVASILTTCAAFVPLYFFGGRFGLMVKFIPPIIFLMLFGSLFEALFILPGHMIISIEEKISAFSRHLKLLLPAKFSSKKGIKPEKKMAKHWFFKWEDRYGKLVDRILSRKLIVFSVFILLLVVSLAVAGAKMKYVMFPDEETQEIRLSAEAPEGAKRYETARLIQPLEDILLESVGKEVVGFRTFIAQGRRGSTAQENFVFMRIEIVAKEKRKKSADKLIAQWQKRVESVKGLKKVKFSKSWHGQASGSPIEILVKENNNQLRQEISDKLAGITRKHPALTAVEIDVPVVTPEYRISLDRDKARRLSISPTDVARTLRAGLEGTILYDFMSDDEEVSVRLTTVESEKADIESVLNIPVENRGEYLVPLRDIVFVEEAATPDSIIRFDEKRTTFIYADLVKAEKKTPLDIARYFEENVFPALLAQYPSAGFEFGGEIKDTRESQSGFGLAVFLVLVLIYIILALLFDSLGKPLIIMLSIPFSVVGVIIAFWAHGITLYGLFAVIGVLGLAGVVVNDAIIMLAKLDKEYDPALPAERSRAQIAAIAKTRLRAVTLTTLTTVAGIIPTAYGWAGYDAMLAQMMLALCWGLIFGTLITLVLIPCAYSVLKERRFLFKIGAREKQI
jgi:multidrug efflux pump subunit AcrB